MRVWIGALAALAALSLCPRALASQVCGVQEELASASFEGEVAEGDAFMRGVGENLTFVLAPTEFGWRIDMFGPEGANFAELTPPQRMSDSNPRALNGWHFRNGDNSGPNMGDVNAPQHFRTFVFGPGALDPELAAISPVQFDNSPAYGRGEFEIVGMDLTRARAGERARMTRMRFRACVEWSPSEIYPAPGAVFDVVIADTLEACGLPDSVRLSDHMSWGPYAQPNYLEPDMDGDGVAEIAAAIVRVSDLKRGVAVCWRDGSRLELLGLEGGLGEHLVAEYFDHMDYWSVHQARDVNQGVAEGAPPMLQGDALLLGKEGASSVLVYLGEHGFTSHWQGD